MKKHDNICDLQIYYTLMNMTSLTPTATSIYESLTTEELTMLLRYESTMKYNSETKTYFFPEENLDKTKIKTKTDTKKIDLEQEIKEIKENGERIIEKIDSEIYKERKEYINNLLLGSRLLFPEKILSLEDIMRRKHKYIPGYAASCENWVHLIQYTDMHAGKLFEIILQHKWLCNADRCYNTLISLSFEDIISGFDWYKEKPRKKFNEICETAYKYFDTTKNKINYAYAYYVFAAMNLYKKENFGLDNKMHRFAEILSVSDFIKYAAVNKDFIKLFMDEKTLKKTPVPLLTIFYSKGLIDSVDRYALDISKKSTVKQILKFLKDTRCYRDNFNDAIDVLIKYKMANDKLEYHNETVVELIEIYKNEKGKCSFMDLVKQFNQLNIKMTNYMCFYIFRCFNIKDPDILYSKKLTKELMKMLSEEECDELNQIIFYCYLVKINPGGAKNFPCNKKNFDVLCLLGKNADIDYFLDQKVVPDNFSLLCYHIRGGGTKRFSSFVNAGLGIDKNTFEILASCGNILPGEAVSFCKFSGEEEATDILDVYIQKILISKNFFFSDDSYYDEKKKIGETDELEKIVMTIAEKNKNIKKGKKLLSLININNIFVSKEGDKRKYELSYIFNNMRTYDSDYFCFESVIIFNKFGFQA